MKYNKGFYLAIAALAALGTFTPAYAQSGVAPDNQALSTESELEISGLMRIAGNLPAQRLQMLKTGFPRISNVGVLFVATDMKLLVPHEVQDLADQAASLGIVITPLQIRRPADIASALARAAAAGVNAYFVSDAAPMARMRQSLAKQIAETKLPVVLPGLDDSALLSYSPAYEDMQRRNVAYIEELLRSQWPEDLPTTQLVEGVAYITHADRAAR